MMKLISEKKGIALVAVLIFSLIGLAISAAVMQMVVVSTRGTGLFKSYATALDAAKGGAEVIIDMIDHESSDPSIGDLKSTQACWQDKLSKETLEWGQNCSSTVDPADSPDLEVTLGSYKTQLKIVDTRITSAPAGGTYYFYSIEILSQHVSNSQEKVRVSFLYRVEQP